MWKFSQYDVIKITMGYECPLTTNVLQFQIPLLHEEGSSASNKSTRHEDRRSKTGSGTAVIAVVPAVAVAVVIVAVVVVAGRSLDRRVATASLASGREGGGELGGVRGPLSRDRDGGCRSLSGPGGRAEAAGADDVVDVWTLLEESFPQRRWIHLPFQASSWSSWSSSS